MHPGGGQDPRRHSGWEEAGSDNWTAQVGQDAGVRAQEGMGTGPGPAQASQRPHPHRVHERGRLAEELNYSEPGYRSQVSGFVRDGRLLKTLVFPCYGSPSNRRAQTLLRVVPTSNHWPAKPEEGVAAEWLHD